MSMRARDLKVKSYRSFPEYRLDLDEGVTVLVGANAAGKTNLIEALQLLTSGASFRHPSPRDLVRAGDASCSLALRVEGDGRVLDLGMAVEDGKRSFRRNGKRVGASGVRGVLPSVLFCPDHLDMVKRSASVRRAALDDFGVQMSARYDELVRTYERTVAQRNALLKESWCCREMLGAWNESLAGTGAALLVHRLALLERVAAHATRAYAQVAAGEEAQISYASSIGEIPRGLSRDQTRERARDLFLAALDSACDEELRRGLTLVGPHRDEIEFSIAGRPARTFASQGQQRTLVLAWKVAEVEVASEILGATPLLLLDDVMSELDASRREAFIGLMGNQIQTVITTTNLGYFSPEVLDRAKVVHIGGEK